MGQDYLWPEARYAEVVWRAGLGASPGGWIDAIFVRENY